MCLAEVGATETWGRRCKSLSAARTRALANRAGIPGLRHTGDMAATDGAAAPDVIYKYEASYRLKPAEEEQ